VFPLIAARKVAGLTELPQYTENRRLHVNSREPFNNLPFGQLAPDKFRYVKCETSSNQPCVIPIPEENAVRWRKIKLIERIEANPGVLQNIRHRQGF
jgi:hypothetical protein